jgi:NADH-quinone oxidoreductase subunit F
MVQESYDHFLNKLLAQTGTSQAATVPILQGIQHEYRYLPADALRRASELTGIPLAHLVGVSTFYHQFRHRPAGRHIMRVCHGTACHVKASENIQEAIERELHVGKGEDTSPDGEFTLERVGCLGCCTLAPVVMIDHTTYGHLAANTVGTMVESFRVNRHKTIADVDGIQCRRPTVEPEIRVGLGSCCMAKGSDDLFHRLRHLTRQAGLTVSVRRVGCVGMCYQTPIVEVRLPNRAAAFYANVVPDDAEMIVRRHFRTHRFGRRFVRWVDRQLEQWVSDWEQSEPVSDRGIDIRSPAVAAFIGRQVRIATEHFGDMDPLDLDEHIACDGFKALGKVLSQPPEETIAAVTASGLRGRGGGGFPTGTKWARVRAAQSPDGKKYIIVNGDEGDPGAFMDRMLMESFPFRLIEGMLIAAYSVGADEGYIYVRAEYPRAVSRLREAQRMLEERGFLGDRVLGAPFSFRLKIFEGAGAFVCGEETALLESIEGRRGIPRLKPPFPADCGLWQRPTLINNVETYTVVPWIIRHGPQAFAAYGTEKSKGTKVFALAGKINRAGLIEVPMGITLGEIIEEVGGGVANGKRLKAVQVGGPSGGCIPAALAQTPVDYEALTAAGAMMGSGGLVVLDEDDCMVDQARFFMSFLKTESCGECTFCRIGTTRMWEILDTICNGKGSRRDLDELQRLAGLTAQGSICGLGRTAANPVLTTLRYFMSEYEAHLAGRCPAGKCKPLIKYVVHDGCTGCTICAQHCPVNAIPIKPYQKHAIDLNICTRCDVCRVDCPEQVIKIE